MFLLELLAKYGPYAFVLMSVWFSLAFVVAAWRVRLFRARKCVLSLLLEAVNFLIWTAIPLVNVPSMYRSDLWFQLLLYALFFFYMLILVRFVEHTKRRPLPTWREAGYRSLIDVLLFRRPYTTEPVEAAPPSEEDRHFNRLTYFLVFGIAVFLLVIIFLGNSLRPCKWLDTLTQHSGCVREIKLIGKDPRTAEFSVDSSALAIQGLVDAPLELYRVEDGAQLWATATTSSYRGSLSFSPDGKTLANANASGKVGIWNWRTGKLQKELATQVDTVQFSPDGQYLATGEDKSGIQLWRVSDWTIARTLPAQAEVMSFSPDGKFIVGAGVSRTLTIWKIEDGTVFQILPGNGYVPYFIAYSPDGTKLANSSLLGPVQIWNIANGSLASTLPISNTKGLAFSPDGQYLLVADWRFPESPQDVITLWRMADGQLVMKMSEDDRLIGDIDSVAFSPDGKFFAYGTWEKLKIFRIPAELQ